jgi:hypothetical protein
MYYRHKFTAIDQITVWNEYMTAVYRSSEEVYRAQQKAKNCSFIEHVEKVN